MEPQQYEVVLYQSEAGCPFEEWKRRLKDGRVRGIVNARIARVRLGNLGNCEPVGEGVFELKIDFGPGYRIYFGHGREQTIVLLCGGDKSSQTGDIANAKLYWGQYKRGES